jgi:DNA invertase Pin-like site-specific DNA recombinase
MARVFGYSRPTASLPDPESHERELAKAGAETILVERNGAQARRAMRQRRRLIDEISEGDTLILLSLDRLGTSFEDVLRCFELLVNRGVNLRIVEPGFKTATPRLEAYRELLALLGGARSALHSDAIKLARAEGGKSGGTLSTLTPEQWPAIKERLRTEQREAVAIDLGVSRQTLWTYRRKMVAQEDSAGPAHAVTDKRLG